MKVNGSSQIDSGGLAKNLVGLVTAIFIVIATIVSTLDTQWSNIDLYRNDDGLTFVPSCDPFVMFPWGENNAHIQYK